MVSQNKFIAIKIITVGLLLSCNSYVLADTTLNINKSQLQEAQEHVKQEGSAAIAKAPEAKKALANINLKQLDLTNANNEMKQSESMFRHTKPLSNTLPSGQKYYLYSESIVSDSKQALAQYNKPALDINQTISDYNSMLKNAKTQIGDNRLLIFVSSSMPKKTLTNLMQQASALGAVFVIRGLINGSYVNTYRYFYKLKGDNTVGIMINPTLFSAFKVDQVPTYALYQSQQDLLQTACKVAPVFTKVSGEVTVKYALEQLKRSKISQLSQMASNELDILDQQSFYGRTKK